MTETSVILALKPEWKRLDISAIRPSRMPHSEQTFTTSGLAQAEELVTRLLTGEDYRKMPRFGELTSGDPADIAAAKENARIEAQHAAWLQKHPLTSLQ